MKLYESITGHIIECKGESSIIRWVKLMNKSEMT
jgi:hypothetical protein